MPDNSGLFLGLTVAQVFFPKHADALYLGMADYLQLPVICVTTPYKR